MRRPDLPLILALAAGVLVLAVLVDPPPGERGPSEPPGPASVPDAIADFNSRADPALSRCLLRIPGDDSRPADPTDLDAVVAQTSERVERLRRLRFRRAVDTALLDDAEFEARLNDDVLGGLKAGQLRREGEVLIALGALPAATDLPQLLSSSLASQVGGFYDPRSEQLVVPTAGEATDDDEVVLAHELEHALADQALGIRDRVSAPAAADTGLAYASVVEGDAALLMFRYALTYALAAVITPTQDVASEEEFAALPDYVQRNLLFPYIEGMGFVCDRFLDGGFAAIDGLYEQPPTTTAEVLFPDRYGRGARQVSLPPRPGPGWRALTGRELGAAELEWLFEAPGGDPEAGLPDARALVFGWAGGELELWERGSERALAVALTELRGSERLCGALAAWYRAGWPEAEVEAGVAPVVLTFTEPDRHAVLACEGTEVRLGIGPDAATARALAG